MNDVINAAIGYWLLLISVRVIGRRTASQMAPFDLVILFLLAGTSIAAIIGGDHSITGALSVIFTVGLMHILASWLKSRFDWFGRIVDGTPVVLYERGHWHKGRMLALRVQRQDVMAACRQRGLQRLEQVRYAICERDGKVSIIEEADPDSDEPDYDALQEKRAREATRGPAAGSGQGEANARERTPWQSSQS
jgi:uncharacterized membrane protein YcaP (DUF421 family)